MSDQLIIFDTTLRDGEQAPGIALNSDEKLAIAHQLAKLRVDVIEAGFAAASDGDFEAVARIAREVKGPVMDRLQKSHFLDELTGQVFMSQFGAMQALGPANGPSRIHAAG